ncbi:hypothetical protein COW36_12155 [bacterium (Candidatus Blackallbacteria) CG17_big_fil_post_rev_8_21_14_2_50_48_46]|uniref:Trigger factor n=1 Tax=bacterium (Candidatus Blackallbacteria) CG17_big_fil_post_rev_8_21_14_2_50_48_46 TaxID=2014261 RepID=A0A2M7G3R2_9BACT|nr:MAG: hypothetical protein COW64_03105 [bacterium (Candidatus Blackallbacteria) CG18_big_fil_WC_8_21_14_2_50_49_26]PIW16512.1 MAG: hypothetical protein COW36_12155 [bacterium (Candidatus Blackallbacteria) CG17_big_fil_post_rev_8_21_14_2_50_48_46]PIW46020.1 MAG: hypothetical protein COW20_17420 [bacterium (Candidatus Blackallbacteria) CG13_big_fil_rev_8_21_14_2_50_49_14]
MKYAVKEKSNAWIDVSFQLSNAELAMKQRQIETRLPQKPSPDELNKLVRQTSMRDAVQAYLKKESLTTWGLPRYKVVQEATESGLNFISRLSLLPEIKLPNYENLQLEVNPVPMPTEEGMQAELFQLKYLVSNPVEVTRGIQWGDIVELGFSAFDSENQPIPLSTRERQSMIINGALFYPEFLEQILGLKAGEKFEFQFKAPADYFHPPAQNQAVTYRGMVYQVMEPQHVQSDQEFLERVGEFENMDALYAQIAEDVLIHNQNAWQKELRQAVVQLLNQNTEVTFSEELLQSELRSEWERLERDPLIALGYAETILEQSWLAWQSLPPLKEQTKNKLKNSLILYQIVKEQNLTVDPSEVIALMMATADTFGGDSPEALFMELKRSKKLDSLVAQFESEKAVDYLMGRLTVICQGEVLISPQAE